MRHDVLIVGAGPTGLVLALSSAGLQAPRTLPSEPSSHAAS